MRENVKKRDKLYHSMRNMQFLNGLVFDYIIPNSSTSPSSSSTSKCYFTL